MAYRVVLVLLLIPCLALPPTALAEANQADLIAAWEAQQRNDPQTLVFEPLAEGRYRFKTERFPFDGELQVLNAVINRMPLYKDPVIMGFVEVELLDLPAGFMAKYAHSYPLWQQTHTLYYLADTDRWVPAEVWQQQFAVDYQPQWWVALLSNYFWIVLLLVVVLVLRGLSRKANRQMNGAMQAQDKALAEQARAIALSERAIALQEEGVQLLREIRDALRP